MLTTNTFFLDRLDISVTLIRRTVHLQGAAVRSTALVVTMTIAQMFYTA